MNTHKSFPNISVDVSRALATMCERYFEDSFDELKSCFDEPFTLDSLDTLLYVISEGFKTLKEASNASYDSHTTVVHSQLNLNKKEKKETRSRTKQQKEYLENRFDDGINDDQSYYVNSLNNEIIQYKNKEIKVLKQKCAYLLKRMDEIVDLAEEKINLLSFERWNQCCGDKVIGEMIEMATQKKLLTLTNEISNARKTSLKTQQYMDELINITTIPINIFEYFNGCTKIVCVPINNKAVIKKIVVNKFDELIKVVDKTTFFIEVQQHPHIAYDRINEITYFLIKESERRSLQTIQHPSGVYFDLPKNEIVNEQYQIMDGIKLEVRIVSDEEYVHLMNYYYGKLNDILRQQFPTYRVNTNIIKTQSTSQKEPIKVSLSRINWTRIPKTFEYKNNIKICPGARPGEERIIAGEKYVFVQDDVDFISLKQTNNPFDKLCVIDLAFNEKEYDQIHTPIGIFNKPVEQNGSIIEIDCGLGGIQDYEYCSGKLYVSYVQSYVEQSNKTVFEKDYCPEQFQVKKLESCVTIPDGYDKDVYYWDYQVRRELFNPQNYGHIPIYFPIPVIKKRDYCVLFRINTWDGQLIQINVKNLK
ncbi:hypothetical protein QTN25_002823 [Entamoeba marina]